MDNLRSSAEIRRFAVTKKVNERKLARTCFWQAHCSCGGPHGMHAHAWVCKPHPLIGWDFLRGFAVGHWCDFTYSYGDESCTLYRKEVRQPFKTAESRPVPKTRYLESWRPSLSPCSAFSQLGRLEWLWCRFQLETVRYFNASLLLFFKIVICSGGPCTYIIIFMIWLTSKKGRSLGL